MQFRGGVLLCVMGRGWLMVGRVLSLLLFLLSVTLTAPSTSSPTTPSTPVFHISARCLRE